MDEKNTITHEEFNCVTVQRKKFKQQCLYAFKKKSVGAGIFTIMGQGEYNGHSNIMLVGCVN